MKASQVAQLWKNQLANAGDASERVSIPEKSQGQKSLTGYSPWGHRVRHHWVIERAHMLWSDGTRCWDLSVLVLSFGFADSSVGKETACNAEDPVLIPGLGRSAGEGLGYPLQYSWASLVAQLVKNPPAMWETWVWSLGWEDPRRRKRLLTPVFWPGDHKESDTTVRLSLLLWQKPTQHCKVIILQF